MKVYFKKMRGGAALPSRAQASSVAWSFFRGLVAIETVSYMTAASGTSLVLGSFGASCVLLFGFPDNPFLQPRNVIGAPI